MNFFKKFGECSYSTKGREELFSKIGTHYLESQKSLFQTSILLEKVEGNKKKKEWTTSCRRTNTMQEHL